MTEEQLNAAIGAYDDEWKHGNHVEGERMEPCMRAALEAYEQAREVPAMQLQTMSQDRLDEIRRAELPKGRAVIYVAELLDEVDALLAQRQQPPQAVEQYRAALEDLVVAMETWGSLEDGIPDSAERGEYGFVGRSYDTARLLLGRADQDGKRNAAIVRAADALGAAERERDTALRDLAEAVETRDYYAGLMSGVPDDELSFQAWRKTCLREVDGWRNRAHHAERVLAEAREQLGKRTEQVDSLLELGRARAAMVERLANEAHDAREQLATVRAKALENESAFEIAEAERVSAELRVEALSEQLAAKEAELQRELETSLRPRTYRDRAEDAEERAKELESELNARREAYDMFGEAASTRIANLERALTDTKSRLQTLRDKCDHMYFDWLSCGDYHRAPTEEGAAYEACADQLMDALAETAEPAPQPVEPAKPQLPNCLKCKDYGEVPDRSCDQWYPCECGQPLQRATKSRLEPAKPQVTLEALQRQMARHERALRHVILQLDKPSWDDVTSGPAKRALDTDHAAEAGK
jgi:hypothetical protein